MIVAGRDSWFQRRVFKPRFDPAGAERVYREFDEERGFRRALRAGEGLLIQPASVLHRGISPKRGPRFVLALCLLPSPIHWREALRRGAMPDLARDETWPRHASELLRSMGLPA